MTTLEDFRKRMALLIKAKGRKDCLEAMGLAPEYAAALAHSPGLTSAASLAGQPHK